MKRKAAIILSVDIQDSVYPPSVRAGLDKLCEVVVDRTEPEEIPSLKQQLEPVEILFSSWGSPHLDAPTLSAMPKLQAVFYAAGSLKSLISEEFWDRNIPVCSAWAANAIPVAEFTFAQIILGLKEVLRMAELLRKHRAWRRPPNFHLGGAYGTTVGLVSLGQIGYRVAERLKTLDVRVLAYDPFCKPETAAALGVTMVSLEEIFRSCRVVSLHTPWLPQTEGMVSGDLIRTMQNGATLINTSRGAIIKEAELIEVLRERPDLTAVLDVTRHEPTPTDSPLYDLSNVFLTPHIAGSMGLECGRMGQLMVDECQRFIHGQPLQWRVCRDAFERMA